MSHRRPGSCRHGPRPVSSRRSSSSSVDSVQESAEELSCQSGNLSRPISSTSSTSQSSSLFTSEEYEEAIDCSIMDVELKRKHHIRRPRRKMHGPRPLPPIPQNTRRPPLSLDIPSSAEPSPQSRRRWLPVPPLPMTSFPPSKY